MADRRSEAFAAWRRFLEALSEQRPLVVVFDDLHWADDALLDFVDELADRTRGVSILVLATARPELLSRRPGWGGGKLNASTILVGALSDEEKARLVHDLLGRALLDAEAQAELLDRAEGNPLYAEEFVRMHAERPEQHTLPESIHGLIAARLDALPREEKELVQTASVMGRVFWLGWLGQERWTVEELLHALERKEFVRRERRASVAGETEYVFRHALVRDVAYDQIPRAERGAKHQAAAAWIESLGQPEDHAELLAHHYAAVLDYLAVEPEEALAAKARAGFRDAGERALALNASATAIAYFSRALDLWSRDDPERPRLLFGNARALAAAGDDRADSALAEAEEALVAAGDLDAAAEAAALRGNAAWMRGQTAVTLDHLERARRLVKERPPSPAKARVLAILARRRVIAGQPEEAITIAEEAGAIADTLGMDDERVHVLNSIGLARVNLGDDEGVDDLERSVELAVAVGSPEAASAYNNLAALVDSLGDIRRAASLGAEAARLSERFGHRQLLRFVNASLLWYALVDGRWDEALRLADEFVAQCEMGSLHYCECDVRARRGHILMERGQRDAALDDLQRAVALVHEMHDPQMAEVLGQLAASYFRFGDVDAARDLARERLAYRRVITYGPGYPALAFIAGELCIQDDFREAVADMRPTPWTRAWRACLDGEFARAAGIYRDMGASVFEPDARIRAGKEAIEAGRRAEGEPELRRALDFYRSAGALLTTREIESLLGAAAQAQ